MLRLFETGNREEDRLLKNLSDIGIDIQTRDTNGRQFHYVDEDNKFLSGSVDGIGRGFIEAPKTKHVIEVKTMNTANFKAMKTAGVMKSKPQHYAQMQLYMLWSGLDRAYYFAVLKDTDDIYGERVKFNKAYTEQLREKARIVTTATVPPVRLNDNPDYYQCRYCDFKDICHGKCIPNVSCRTCAHSTPNLKTGMFDCALGHDDYDCKYCADHLYNPALIPLPVYGVNVGDEPSVTYLLGDVLVTNGFEGFSGFYSSDFKDYVDLRLKP
jgi:CRISPR/Cas system-associated exonuclease Cas4 (RecB family)